MGKEYEIEILDIDQREAERGLRAVGARYVGSHSFRRVEFLLSGDIGGSHSWGRVRSDGKKTTITLKELNGDDRMAPMVEREISTDNFEGAVRIVGRLVGQKSLIYFENSRKAYVLGSAYITIDKWPGIPPFMEIEAKSMQVAHSIYKRLGIKGKMVGNAPIREIYRHYGLDFEKEVGKNDRILKRLLVQRRSSKLPAHDSYVGFGER